MRTTSLISPNPMGRYRSDDLLNLPEDGKRYWLVDGRIVEMGLADRSKRRSIALTSIGYRLSNWRDSQPRPRGSVHIGEVGVLLDPATELTVEIDLVYLSPEQVARNANDDLSTMIVGPPTLAVEILSPSNTIAIIHKKIDTYLSHGVAVVWLIDTHFRTVTVHRPGRPSVMLNSTEELDGAPELPGFRVPVAMVFND